jgi:DNA-binding transcriptional MerR regulator
VLGQPTALDLALRAISRLSAVPDLFSIGRVARLSGLTPKALRHYDSVGLLRPAAIADTNGYRLYSWAQIEDARKIRVLRELDVPLDEIRRILAGGDTDGRLREHRRRIEARLTRMQTIHYSLGKVIEGQEIERMSMSKRRPDTAPTLDPETQRSLAANLFNYVWTLLEREERTKHDEDIMVHAAHTCRYMWDAIGEAVNHARGEWQISRVYATLNRAEPALHHAQRCLDICEEHGIGDFDLAYAYEALARAHAVMGESDPASRYTALAREAGARISELDDRELFESDLATVPATG